MPGYGDTLGAYAAGKHLTDEVEEKDRDVPCCRVCGCTEDEACEGGCRWVEDPEGLGDLCSRCLAAAAHEPAETAS